MQNLAPSAPTQRRHWAALAGLAIAVGVALAQFGGPGGDQGGPPMGGPGGLAGRQQPPQVSLTANNQFVYVIQAGTLSQYDANTLKLVNKVELPRPTGGPGAAAQGGQGGQGGPGGGFGGPAGRGGPGGPPN